ncbi:MAG: hypothetical protein KatS3mg060_1342 [Dehalococcoidia bacterium]|nr:MAG: hypothetical protein KatS3mg060_1342 [Dehalococcoidia bacterium]
MAGLWRVLFGSIVATFLVVSGAANITAAPFPSSFTVTNPASGAELWVEVLTPTGWDGRRLPTLVLVPGGNGDSTTITSGGRAQRMADAGFAIVVFDPDGRGRSGGVEDYGGFIHQDGLAAIIAELPNHPAVDRSQIGIVSNSYGVTIAAGMLARHPDLRVRFLIDWEGPADRSDTGGCGGAPAGHLRNVASCDDESFWHEREAITFIGSIRVPYLRMQSERDHVQADVFHAIRMVNAAVAGDVPWVRLNNERPNQLYSLADLPTMLPERLDRERDRLILEYARELFRLDVRS